MKRFFTLLCAVVAFAACEQVFVDVANDVAESDRSLSVSFEGDETRVQLNEAQKTVWNRGDRLSVFYRSTVNEEWHFMGETGDRTGEIVPVDNSVNPPATHNRTVVVYPYNAGYFFNAETYNIEASMPAVQHYLKDSYGANGNIMVSSSEFNKVSLKSVCGWLKLQLTGVGEVVKSITLRGNDGEQVAGLIYVDSATATATLASAMGEAGDEVGGVLVRPGAILTEVTLDCGEGVTLGAEATAFYIALPPQTFENGLTVDVNCKGYKPMSISTSNGVTIDRNHIQPMKEVVFSSEVRTIAANEIWYTATAKVEPTYDDAPTFGAFVVSNVWDSETKRGIITFDGDVTMIGDSAFWNCDSLTSVNIPDSVTTIGEYTFSNCKSLTSVNIPDSVTTIGEYTFSNCKSLTSVNIPDSVTTIGNAAFNGCDSLTSVNIPDSVTTIGESAFRNCDSLTSVTIGDSVTTIGEDAFYSCDSLTSVIIGDSVTTIGNYAFYNCTSLTSVNIGDSVTTIGNYAFRNCDSLTEFTGKFAEDNGRILVVDGVLTAFAPAGISEYNIPDGVTTIGNAAFADCDSLTSVTIGDSVTSIEEGAFSSCDSLTSVTIGDSVTSIGEGAFSGCDSLTSVTIGDSVTTIGNYAFYDCDSLKKVFCYATTPPALGYDAFYNNASVRRIYVYEECVELYKSAWSSYKDCIFTNGKNCPDITTIEYTTNDGNIVTPKNMLVVSNIYENGVGTLVVAGKITQIPNNAFQNCTSLTSVNIPDSVTEVGANAFYSCGKLVSVTIGDSVTTIGINAFSGCTSLTSVNIPDSVTTIGEWAFSHCDSLTSVNIPDSVTSIGYYAFYSCGSLTEFTGKFAEDNGRILVVDGVLTAFAPAGITEYNIPDSVTAIGNSVFRNCTSLTSVNIPDSVTTIEWGTFEYCSSLTSVTIPDSVTTIENSAFFDCSSLTSVYCKATTPPVLGNSYVFDNNGWGRKIYVPAGSVNAYKSATGWSEYKYAIVGYDF